MTSQHSSQAYHPLRNRVLALAAMVQAAYLVQGIARRGKADAVEVECAIDSILATPGSERIHADHLYQQPKRLRTGLILMQGLLAGEEVGADINQAKELMRYCASMIALEKKLSRNREMLGLLATGLERIKKQCEYFGGATHDNVIAAIASLYGETISTLKPRIIVHGKPEFLSHGRNTNKVRALLFSGVRAAHLWRMHGGGHFQLLLRRRMLGREARQLLLDVEQG